MAGMLVNRSFFALFDGQETKLEAGDKIVAFVYPERGYSKIALVKSKYGDHCSFIRHGFLENVSSGIEFKSSDVKAVESLIDVISVLTGMSDRIISREDTDLDPDAKEHQIFIEWRFE